MIMRQGQQLLLPANPLFVWGSLMAALFLNMLQNMGLWGRATWAPDLLAVVLVLFLLSAWAMDAQRTGVFAADDSLALRLSQPLRVDSGGLWLNLPVDYSYATLSPVYGRRLLSLAPSGREQDIELVWRGALWNGTAMASLYYRKDPGHYSTLTDDRGMAVSWNWQF